MKKNVIENKVITDVSVIKKQQNLDTAQPIVSQEMVVVSCQNPSLEMPHQNMEMIDVNHRTLTAEFNFSDSESQQINTPYIFERIFPMFKPKPKLIKSLSNSFVLAQACTGFAHMNHRPYALPCQDTVQANIKPRPILIACDGAGSSAVSEIGSSTLAVNITRFCQSIEPLLKISLDGQEVGYDLRLLTRMIIRHALGCLEDLSIQHRRDMKDFRSTLNLAIVGEQRILWVKVGDGEIVQQRITQVKNQIFEHQALCLGEHAKGEFANQTQFIDTSLTFDDVSWGCLDRTTTTGLALMSDGGSERLVAHHREKVSGTLHHWWALLRQQKLKASDIAKCFYSEEFNARTTGDDRSIALWSAELEI